MSEVIVAFWTGTGNTAEMAEYVAEGIKEGGAEAKVVSVDDISAADFRMVGYRGKNQLLRLGRRRMDEKLGRADGRSRSNCCWRRRRNLSGSSR